MLLDSSLRIARIVPCTKAEGPGRRFALWFQGCPLRCPGCCNPEMLTFEGGTSISLRDLVARIEETARKHGIEGITLLGGEPSVLSRRRSHQKRTILRIPLDHRSVSAYTFIESASPCAFRLRED
jgi:organic radical activating enzyme